MMEIIETITKGNCDLVIFRAHSQKYIWCLYPTNVDRTPTAIIEWGYALTNLDARIQGKDALNFYCDLPELNQGD